VFVDFRRDEKDFILGIIASGVAHPRLARYEERLGHGQRDRGFANQESFQTERFGGKLRLVGDEIRSIVGVNHEIQRDLGQVILVDRGQIRIHGRRFLHLDENGELSEMAVRYAGFVRLLIIVARRRQTKCEENAHTNEKGQKILANAKVVIDDLRTAHGRLLCVVTEPCCCLDFS